MGPLCHFEEGAEPIAESPILLIKSSPGAHLLVTSSWGLEFWDVNLARRPHSHHCPPPANPITLFWSPATVMLSSPVTKEATPSDDAIVLGWGFSEESSSPSQFLVSFTMQPPSHFLVKEPHAGSRTSMSRTVPHSTLGPSTSEQKDTGPS